ncbi:MAG: CocE/NonD family hydrolase [Pseudomonadota bacterium]
MRTWASMNAACVTSNGLLLAAILTCGPGLSVAEDAVESPVSEADEVQSIPFEKGPHNVRVERSHFVEMRDGVRLMTDLYFPEGIEDRLPLILERTPYDKAKFRNSDPEAPIDYFSKAYYYASHGYVFAVQDRRGKFESEGDYSLSYNDVDDTQDTLDWFEKQPWFNGRAGMIGCSIPGGNVIRAAMTTHKTLKGLVPQSAGFGHGTAGGTMAKGFLRGGVQNMTMPLWTHYHGSKLFFRPSKRLSREEYLRIVELYSNAPNIGEVTDVIDMQSGTFTEETIEKLLHLPLVEIDDLMGSPPSDWDKIVSERPTGSWWSEGDYLEDGDKVDGGALHINSWHDYGANETFLQYEYFHKNAESKWARDNQYLIMGPLGHCSLSKVSSHTINGEREIGDARFDSWGTYLKWWDYTLKGKDNDFETTPRIQYFLPGANEWRSSNHWPIHGTEQTRLYLTSAGNASTGGENGKLVWEKPEKNGSDAYIYDPADPVLIPKKNVQAGSFDLSEVGLRDDVLVYSTAPLERDVEVTGKMRAKVWLSTDVPDTDLAVRILDVYPDGRAYGIQESYLRLRYRDGFEEEVMLEPGRIYPIDLDMLVAANLFKKGHRIRVDITSSNFPSYGRNLNTGGDNARDTDYQPASVNIHHGPEMLSYIEIPIIEADEQ